MKVKRPKKKYAKYLSMMSFIYSYWHSETLHQNYKFCRTCPELKTSKLKFMGFIFYTARTNFFFLYKTKNRIQVVFGTLMYQTSIVQHVCLYRYFLASSNFLNVQTIICFDHLKGVELQVLQKMQRYILQVRTSIANNETVS